MKMRRLFTAALLTVIAATAALAQNSGAEQEVRKLVSEMDRAFAKNDVAYFESVLADDYVLAGTDGKTKTRAELLAEMRKEVEKPTYKLTANASEDVRVRVSGDMAVVTAIWRMTTVGPESNPWEPHKDEGRYTTVLQRRGGRWVVVADHVTERPHTPEEFEPELRKASESYDAAMKARDAAAFGRLLADDYAFTGPGGVVRNKAEDIAHMTSSDTKIESATTDDKKIRIYRSTAVETGRYTVTGTHKGKPFTETGRYTTTWVRRDGRWQIVSDHTSVLPQTSTASR